MGVILDAVPIEIAVLRRCCKCATVALSTYTHYVNETIFNKEISIWISFLRKPSLQLLFHVKENLPPESRPIITCYILQQNSPPRPDLSYRSKSWPYVVRLNVKGSCP